MDNAKDTKKSARETLIKIEDKSREIDRTIADVMCFIDRDLMPKYEEASNKANSALLERNKVLAKANTYLRMYSAYSVKQLAVLFGQLHLSISDGYSVI